MQEGKRNIALFGSTGSIGRQTLDVVRRYSNLFGVHTLTAGRNAKLLIEQAREFCPDTVVIADEGQYADVCNALADLPIKVYAGEQALADAPENEHIDIVVSALVGFAGLRLTVNAIRAHKLLALANKETLVVAGELITQLARENRVPILPIDSEHSAILQSLNGEGRNKIEKILLTASGGPFRNFTAEQLATVTASQALQHPNWEMGPKITIDSSTLMNKGFEMIEAKWFFDVEPEQIEVVVHKESIVHSAVQYEDGAVVAQLGCPDMHLPIQYALTYPQRLPIEGERLDLFAIQALHFEKPKMELFPCLRLAYEAVQRGGNTACVLNAANEIANAAFRRDEISFLDIPRVIEESMSEVAYIAKPTLDDIFETDATARRVAESKINRK